jgi:hypothetical protein
MYLPGCRRVESEPQGITFGISHLRKGDDKTPLFFLAFAASVAGSDYPGASWEPHSRQGWSEPLLKAAREYMRSKQTAAVMIIQGGRVVDQWGDVGRKWEVRSIRKSLLSALYGIHVAEGQIELGKTLAEIGIDDTPPLTPIEKQATILACCGRGRVFITSRCAKRLECELLARLGEVTRQGRFSTITIGTSIPSERSSRS